MLSRQQVANDGTIWHSNGLITFPRSDAADARYAAERDEQPKDAAEEEVMNAAQSRWLSPVAASLAQFFDKPEYSPSGRKWYLEGFPLGYRFRYANATVRRRFYLLAGPSLRFSSSGEFADHARWLLTDPELDPTNCLCKPCSKASGSTARHWSIAMRASDTPESPAPSPWPHGLMPEANKVNCLPRPPRPPAPPAPYTVSSCSQRDMEMPRQVQPGKHEGFRLGELCFVKLPRPIESSAGSSADKRIDRWPARVTKRTFKVLLDEPDSHGKVKHERICEVELLFTLEKVSIPEAELMAGLTGNVPSGLGDIHFGGLQDKPWLASRAEPVDFRLMTPSPKPLPPYGTLACAFAYAIHTVNLARSCFVLNDEFSRAPTGLPPPPTLSLVADSPASSPATAAAEGLVDANRYCQGAYLGLERIWLGDLIRLNLTQADLEHLFGALDEKDRVDGIKPDASLSYIMHVKAIYMPKPARKPKPESVSKETGAADANGTATAASGSAPPEEAQEEAKEQEGLDAWSTRVRVAGDVFRVVGQATLAATQRAADGDVAMDDSNGDSAPRSTFLWPLRTFVAEEVTPPISELLPQGFEAQRITRGRAEIECSMQQVAGRLYASFAPKKVDIAQVTLMREQSTGASQTDDSERITLALAGLLPGSNLRMGCSNIYHDTRAVWGLSNKVAKAAMREAVRERAEIFGEPPLISETHIRAEENEQEALRIDIVEAGEAVTQAKRKLPIGESDDPAEVRFDQQNQGASGSAGAASFALKTTARDGHGAPPPSKKPRLSSDDAGSSTPRDAQLAKSVRELIGNVPSSSDESRMEFDEGDYEKPRRTTRSMSKSRHASPARMSVDDEDEDEAERVKPRGRGRSLSRARARSRVASPVESVDYDELPRPKPRAASKARSKSRAASRAPSRAASPVATHSDGDTGPQPRKTSPKTQRGRSKSVSKAARSRAGSPVAATKVASEESRGRSKSVSKPSAAAATAQLASAVAAVTSAPASAVASTTSVLPKIAPAVTAPTTVAVSAAPAETTFVVSTAEHATYDPEGRALPIGWGMKASRNDGKPYYAHPKLKLTAWKFEEMGPKEVERRAKLEAAAKATAAAEPATTATT